MPKSGKKSTANENNGRDEFSDGDGPSGGGGADNILSHTSPPSGSRKWEPPKSTLASSNENSRKNEKFKRRIEDVEAELSELKKELNLEESSSGFISQYAEWRRENSLYIDVILVVVLAVMTFYIIAGMFSGSSPVPDGRPVPGTDKTCKEKIQALESRFDGKIQDLKHDLNSDISNFRNNEFDSLSSEFDFIKREYEGLKSNTEHRMNEVQTNMASLTEGNDEFKTKQNQALEDFKTQQAESLKQSKTKLESDQKTFKENLEESIREEQSRRIQEIEDGVGDKVNEKIDGRLGDIQGGIDGLTNWRKEMETWQHQSEGKMHVLHEQGYDTNTVVMLVVAIIVFIVILVVMIMMRQMNLAVQNAVGRSQAMQGGQDFASKLLKNVQKGCAKEKTVCTLYFNEQSKELCVNLTRTVEPDTKKASSRIPRLPANGTYQCLACDIEMEMLWKIRRHVQEAHFYVKYQCSKCKSLLNRFDNNHHCIRRYGKDVVRLEAIYSKPEGNGKVDKRHGKEALDKLREFKANEQDQMIKLVRAYEEHKSRKRERSRSRERRNEKSRKESKSPVKKIKAKQAVDLEPPLPPISPLPPSPTLEVSLYYDNGEKENDVRKVVSKTQRTCSSLSSSSEESNPTTDEAKKTPQVIRAPSPMKVDAISSATPTTTQSLAETPLPLLSQPTPSTSFAVPPPDPSSIITPINNPDQRSISPPDVTAKYTIVTSTNRPTAFSTVGSSEQQIPHLSQDETATFSPVPFTGDLQTQLGPTLDAPVAERREEYNIGEEKLTIHDRDKLMDLRKGAESKVIVNVGGKYHHTSVHTLTCIPNNVFTKLFHPDSPYMRALKNKATVFLDRDYKHFDIILNFLRNKGEMPMEMLPRDLRQLYEIRTEAIFYELQGLVHLVDMRLTRLFDVRFIS